MQESHIPKWKAMIASITEEKRSDEVVLDYGCNLGGFLKLLHRERGFARGIGVDTDIELINIARSEIQNQPIDFYTISDGDAEDLKRLPEAFHLAFSHEVLHVLGDINQHAKLMKHVLKPNASYYAVRSFSEPKVWERHKEFLLEGAFTPTFLKPDDVVNAFESEQFVVSARLLPFDWFAPYGQREKDQYFSLMGMLEHYSQRKILFRFTKL